MWGVILNTARAMAQDMKRDSSARIRPVTNPTSQRNAKSDAVTHLPGQILIDVARVVTKLVLVARYR